MLNPIPSYLPTNKLLGRVGLSINYVMKHLTNIYLVYLIYELTLVNFWVYKISLSTIEGKRFEFDYYFISNFYYVCQFVYSFFVGI